MASPRIRHIFSVGIGFVRDSERKLNYRSPEIMASNRRNCGTHYTALTLALSTAVCAFPAFKFKTDRRFFLCRRRLRCGGGNRGNYRPNPCCANLFSLPRFPCWANGIGSIEGPLTLEDPIKEHSILDSVNRSGAVSECNLKRKRDLSRHSSRPRPVFRLRRPPVRPFIVE